MNRNLALLLMLGLILLAGGSYFAQSVSISRLEARLELAFTDISRANQDLTESILGIRNGRVARQDVVVRATRQISKNIEALRKEEDAIIGSSPAFKRHLEKFAERAAERSRLANDILSESATMQNSLRAIGALASRLVSDPGGCSTFFEKSRSAIAETVETTLRLALMSDTQARELAERAATKLEALSSSAPTPVCAKRLLGVVTHAGVVSAALSKVEPATAEFSRDTSAFANLMTDRIVFQRSNREWLLWFGLLMLLCTGLLSAMVLFLFRDVDRKSGLLAEANLTLEEKVAKRTAQLWDANSELAAAVDMAEAATEAKSEFLAKMSHEIRTPMNGVMGMADLLARTPLANSQRRLLDGIRRSATSLLEIINDILDFSKMEAGQLTVEQIAFDLRTTIEDTTEVVAQKADEKGLELTILVPHTMNTRRKGDPVRIRQILLNLVSNALKFTDSGHVQVRVSDIADDLAGPLMKFEVEDTGIGLSDDAQSRVFDDFAQADDSTTRRYGGTGLGLAIVKQLAQLMGGEAGVESTIGVGSTFWFTAALPVAKSVSQGPDAKVAQATVLLAKRHGVVRHEIIESIKSVGVKNLVFNLTEVEPAEVDVLFVGRQPFEDSKETAEVSTLGGRAVARRLGLPDSVPVILLATSQDPVVDDREHRVWSLVRPARLDALEAAIRQALDPDAMPQAADSEPSFAQAPSGGWEVLLAEDNEVNQEVGRGMLETLGCNVTVAPDGLKAIELAQSGSYDVLFMDAHMPNMDGLEATHRIRQNKVQDRHGRPVPIIALTANAYEKDRQACLSAGMDDFASKPIQLETFELLIGTWCQSSHSGRRPSQQIAPMQTAPGESVSLKVLDRGAVQRLQKLKTGEGQTIFDKVARLYTKSAPNLIETIGRAVESEDWELLTESAHELKSSSANIGAKRLAAVCADLERYRELDRPPAAQAMVIEIREYLEAVESDIETLMAEV